MECFKDKKLSGVEIGVQYGNNAISMLDNLNIKQLYLIDPYLKYPGYDDAEWVREYTQDDFDDLYKQAKHNLRKYNKAFLFRITSLDASFMFSDFSFDFIYFDGNHKQLYQDLCAWYPMVKNGGIIGGHDFCSHHPFIARDIFRFCEENNISFKPNGECGKHSDWWFKKN